jgi:rare lipoprotein A
MRMRRTIGLSFALLVAAAPAIAGPAVAKEAQPGHHHRQTGHKGKHAADDTAVCRSQSKHGQRQRGAAARSRARPNASAAAQHASPLPPPDQYIGRVRVVGARQVGYAAWYGGRHLGRRTASGDRLDAVHATAAHRSLPLHSLVRVTNLRNGRSAIARITDRGPVSRRLLIDVSPVVAAELDMVHSGIANVAVEPVAATASPAD